MSLRAESIGELRNKIEHTAGSFPCVELRLDYLDPSEFEPKNGGKVVRQILHDFPRQRFVITFRSQKEGGIRSVTTDDRLAFWESIGEAELVDIETDIAKEVDLTGHKIVSSHTFDSSDTSNAEEAAAFCKPDDILKIAVTAEDAVDGIEVFNLLADPPPSIEERDLEVIPIAMGEPGIWTRVLSAAFGAPLIYAAPNDGTATAPGQISGDTLESVYRIHELTSKTTVYGVVGNPVSHSLSPYVHNAAFASHDLDAVYLPFKTEDLDAFIRRMVRRESREVAFEIKGLSVTAPFKQSIIELLDFVDPQAKKTGAVNTVQVVEGHLVGFNTDIGGFMDPLKTAWGDLEGSSVAIAGAGGAARAAAVGLVGAGADVTVLARDLTKARAFKDELDCKLLPFMSFDEIADETQILVNATPLGTKGRTQNQIPVPPTTLKNLQLVYDMVYNPFETLLIRSTREFGVPTIGGLAMLVAQGMRQFEIWTGLKAPMKLMSRAALTRLG